MNSSSFFEKLNSRILQVSISAMMFSFVALSCAAQEMKDQIVRGHEMLGQIQKDIRENYFDIKFRGLNLDERFKAADAEIDRAVSGDQIYGIIAGTLLDLQDSHTFFIPPVWSIDVDYGWEMQIFGDKCFVTSVDKDSDALGKGLKPGDRILALFDVAVTRENFPQLEYLFKGLRPVNPIVVTIGGSDGKPKQLELRARVTKATWASIGEKERLSQLSIQQYVELDGDVFLWKMSAFDLPDKGVNQMLDLVRPHKALILDLRGNSGGFETTLQYLLGYLFEHDVKIGERQGRKESKPVEAKSRRDKSYKGKLIVLVDSRTASAAEIFARIIQLEKRGMVLGDRTAGAVTEARHFIHDYVRKKGFFVSALAVQYGVSVTINNLVMEDGKSLERVGVLPDESILPSPTDLATDQDPVLRRAASLLGTSIDFTKRPLKPLEHTSP